MPLQLELQRDEPRGKKTIGTKNKKAKQERVIIKIF